MNEKTISTMRNVDIAADDLGGKVWIKGGKIRVYLAADFKKNQMAYIEFDEIIVMDDCDNFMHGAALKVFTSCEQSVKWNLNASKKCKHRIMLEIADILDFVVCKTWQEVIL